MSLLKNKVAIRKRFVVTLLLLVLLVMPIVAVKSNVNADTFGVFNYNISYDGKVSITGLNDTSVTSIDIPSEIDGKPVTEIAYGAFNNCKNIKSVNIPNSVISIGPSSFQNCTGITGSLVIPDSVNAVCSYAFQGCTGITELKLGNSVKYVDQYAFEGCTGITGTLVIPDSIGTIGISAFKGCNSILNLKIGTGVASIDADAFNNCSGLSGELTIPGNVKTIGSSAFLNIGKFTSIKLEEGLETIGNYAFFGNTNVTELTIPDSVQTIGFQAFAYYSNLKTLNLGNGVKIIDGKAFQDATSLKEIDIPESVQTINYNAFLNCTSLSTINLPDNNINFGGNVFLNTAWYNSQDAGVVYLGKKLYRYKGAMPSNTTINVIDGTNQICGYAFDSFTNLISISVPDSVKCIDNYAFNNCTGLTDAGVISSDIVGSYAFNNCTNLKNITLGEGITTIEKNAFYNCTGLTKLETPSTINKISDYAFYNCSGLTDVKILSGSLGYNLFNGCNNIKTAYFGEGITTMNGINLSSQKLTDLTILSGNVPSFSGCKNLVNVTLGNKVTEIGSYAFEGCTGLTQIVIPDSVKTIGDSAFKGCSSVEKISIGKGVEKIGNYAFYGLTKFNPDIIIPENVKSVGSYAYANCKSVTSLIINANDVSFGENCFSGCENLEKLIVNGSVRSVGLGSFNNTKIDDATEIGYYYKNKKVKTAIIKEGVESISYNRFLGCENLKTLYIESSVLSSLGDSYDILFYGCNNLEKVVITDDNPNFTVVDDIIYSKDMTRLIRCLPAKKGKVNIPSSVTKIESRAFYGCKYLEGELVIPDSVKELGSYAFSDCLSEIPLKIGSGIKTIGNSAFENSKFTGKLIIPNNVTGILQRAFFNCYNFTGELILSENLSYINSEAFEGCSSISGTLKFPDKIYGIAESAFALCEGIEKIDVGDGINCSRLAFAHCINLKSIVGKNIETQDMDGIFMGCYSLKSLDLESFGYKYSVSGGSSFLECEGIERVGTNFKSIVSDMFRGAKGLKEVEIASGITELPRGIFAECPNLKTVKIPSSVKTIHSLAFYKTTNIQDIYVDNNRSDVNYAEYLESVCPNVHYLDSVYTVNKNVPDNVEIIDVEKPESGEFKYNSNYKFKVNVKDGYKMSNLIVKTIIRGEEKELQPKEINGEDVYVLENIKDNVEINITAEIDLLSLNENDENS